MRTDLRSWLEPALSNKDSAAHRSAPLTASAAKGQSDTQLD